MNNLVCKFLKQMSLALTSVGFRSDPWGCSSSSPVNSCRREKFTVGSSSNQGRGCCTESLEQKCDTKMCFDSTVFMPLFFYNHWLLPEFEIELCFRTYLASATLVWISKRWSSVSEGGLQCLCFYLSNHLSFERKLNSLFFFWWRHSWPCSLGTALFLISPTLN